MRFFCIFAVFLSFCFGLDLYEIYMNAKLNGNNTTQKESNAVNKNPTMHDTTWLEPNKCQSCHRDQTKYWEKSFHAKSHENANPLYKASIDLVAKKTIKSKEEVLVECSTCHNPGIKIKKIDEDYKISKIFGLKTAKTQNIDEQIHHKSDLSGVSCAYCHRIDKIKQGGNFGNYEAKLLDDSNKIIVGPYQDTLKTNYHDSQKRDFFIDSDQLCLVCHDGIGASDKNGKPNPMSAYSTGGEMISNEKSCVECHMSERYETINSSYDDEIRVRYVRQHLFNGAHDIRQLKFGILFRYKKAKQILEIINNSSHMIPTGFGSRMIRITVYYKDQNANILGEHSFDIGTQYSYNGEPALQYYADELKDDNRLAPQEAREFELNLPQNTFLINLKAQFYYLRPDLINLFDSNINNKEIIGPVEIADRVFYVK